VRIDRAVLPVEAARTASRSRPGMRLTKSGQELPRRRVHRRPGPRRRQTLLGLGAWVRIRRGGGEWLFAIEGVGVGASLWG